MARPRLLSRQLPAYCYKDKRSGSLYMMVPAAEGKLQRRTYGTDLHRMMADWADTWGKGQQVGETVNATMDRLLGVYARKREKGELAESTERDYQKHLASLRPVWGAVRWADFDAPGIVAWQEIRGAQSTVQCNRELTQLQALAKLAGQLGLLKDNPLRFIDRLREKPRKRYVTDAEFAAVFEHAQAPVRAAMFIASITGLRQGDILRLRRADFGPDGLLVPTRKTGQPLLFRWTPGLHQAYEMGKDVRAVSTLQWLATARGHAYTSSGFGSLWHRAMERAMERSPQLERFTFNDLRAKAGTESRDWQILGHLDQKTFTRVYNRLPRQVEPTK